MLPLFVYGTLAPNRANHHIMMPIKNGLWQPASIYGKLFPNGWGLSSGYPAVIPDEQGEKIEGFLFSSPELNCHWARLDEFEGVGYNRVPVTAYLDNGETVDAFVYALAQEEVERWRAITTK